MIWLHRVVFAAAAFPLTSGWWPRTPPTPSHVAEEVNTTYWDWALNLSWVNATYYEAAQWAPTSWDGWVWTILDAVGSAFGWLIFGKSWSQVKTGFSTLVRVGAILFICISAHYVLALCWPIVSLVVGLIVTFVWMVRTLLKCCGRIIFYAKRFGGGVPEAADACFIGPDTGETPETAELRKLKKGGEDRWALLRRDGLTVVFRVQDSSTIKSSGLYLTVEPDTLRGDGELVRTLRGHDRVHLCRNQVCNEEGPHFKQYATAKPLNAEKFQLTNAAHLLGQTPSSHHFSRRTITAMSTTVGVVTQADIVHHQLKHIPLKHKSVSHLQKVRLQCTKRFSHQSHTTLSTSSLFMSLWCSTSHKE